MSILATILPECLLLFSSGLPIPTSAKSMPFSSVFFIAFLSGIYLGPKAPLPLGEGAVFVPHPLPRKLGKLPQSPHWSSAVDLIWYPDQRILGYQNSILKTQEPCPAFRPWGDRGSGAWGTAWVHVSAEPCPSAMLSDSGGCAGATGCGDEVTFSGTGSRCLLRRRGFLGVLDSPSCGFPCHPYTCRWVYPTSVSLALLLSFWLKSANAYLKST